MISIHTACQKGLKAESMYKNIDVKEYIEIGQGKGLMEGGCHTKKKGGWKKVVT